MNTKDLVLDDRLFCLFKGDPGSGKSIAAASFPKPFFFDLDGRMKSVMNYWRPRGKEIEYDRPKTFFEVNRRLEEFMIQCPYETIVYDGITSGADQILNDMVSTRDSSAKKRVRAGIELLQIEDYGGESRGLQIIMDNLKVLSFRWNIHVIVTAHIITVTNTDITKPGVTTESRTLLTAGKKVAAKIPKDFDEAYHFDVVPDLNVSMPPRFTVVTQNTGRDWAKTALPLDLRIDFTNASLYDKIMEQVRRSPYVHAVNKLETPNEAAGESLPAILPGSGW